MKACPYCKEDIKDEAVKCRFCGSSLEASDESNQVVYVVDRGLVRFGKFAAAILAMFLAIAAYFAGLDLKETLKEVNETSDKVKTMRDEIAEAKTSVTHTKDEVTRLHEETSKMRDRAQSLIGEITQSRKEAIEKVAGIDVGLTEERVTVIFQSLFIKHLSNVLPEERLTDVKKSFVENRNEKLSRDEVSRLVGADVEKAAAFFRANGFSKVGVKFEIDKDPDYANTYWDGKALFYGMGMVNSEFFGPYESGLVFHEMTHQLFDVVFEGQSGAVSESISDVMAVLIRGSGWTLGFVRSNDATKPTQYLRSLQRPGSAYDNTLLGKDPQPSHMKNFHKTDADSGGVHINSGVLNKAAYLMSEGGTHEGVTVPHGIGRDKLRILYVAVIKSLRSGQRVDFSEFKKIVTSNAEGLFRDKSDIEAVALSFKAVGL
jgi:cell division protein FtsL